MFDQEYEVKNSKTVRVELGPTGLPIRIFRTKEWLDPAYPEVEMTKAAAVGGIRKQVFRRCWNPLSGNFECEKCGRTITWTSGEMNEIVPKGSGGEVSLDNCEALCRSCHQTGPDAAHKDRRWQTAKLSPKE